MKKILLTTLLTASFSAQADIDILHIGNMDRADTKIIVGIGSRHFDELDHKYLNESNPSIGLEMWDIQAVYVSKNSWSEKSLYLTYSPDYAINEHLTLSANIGVANGYKCSNSVKRDEGTYLNVYCRSSGFVPMGALSVDYSPFANNFAFSVAINPYLAIFSINHKI